jgi:hypothetical protein
MAHLKYGLERVIPVGGETTRQGIKSIDGLIGRSGLSPKPEFDLPRDLRGLGFPRRRERRAEMAHPDHRIFGAGSGVDFPFSGGDIGRTVSKKAFSREVHRKCLHEARIPRPFVTQLFEDAHSNG